MEQDDKVSAAALSLATATGSGSASRTHGRSARAPSGEAGHAPEGGEGAVPEESEPPEEMGPEAAKPGNATPKKSNNVRRIRIERMMSKAELARRANLSVLTIDRVERGYGCRMDTKRKILEALGLSLADRVRVFGEEE